MKNTNTRAAHLAASAQTGTSSRVGHSNEQAPAITACAIIGHCRSLAAAAGCSEAIHVGAPGSSTQ